MAKLQLLQLLSLSSIALGQSDSAGAASSTASEAASSASGAASSASSLASGGSSSAASSLSSVAASESSVASSLSSVASSISSVASSIASSTSISILSSSSSLTTTTETSSSVASSSSSSESPSTSSTSDVSSSSSSIETFTSTSSSISFASSSLTSTDVVPTTSDGGGVGFTTIITTVVSSSPASTYVNISPYTTDTGPDSNPTTQADSAHSGSGGGLSSSAKIGIGVGVGLAVLAAAIFGGWYSWYMRKRRRRSVNASDRYPPSSGPSMLGIGGVAYGDKSDTRSELPSPALGGGGVGFSPPMRSPDRLLHPGRGVQSWNSVSNSNHPTSSHSVSDYSERGGQPPPDPTDDLGHGAYSPTAAAVAGGVAGDAIAGGAIHEMPENNRSQQQYPNQRNPPQQHSHNRTISGESRPSELDDGTLPQNQHQRTTSGGAQPYQYPTQGPDGYWQNTQASELPGSRVQRINSRGEGYRGVDPEVPLHQRMQTERVPVRHGHLQKPSPGPGLPPSHNY